ncbi:DUF2254 domain-containing protein [Zavarzinia sp. CC-PAN008]|uniref:DUF2254 domain-containing protein n=1 Tax=Zavarzinia sp. CC-PAN008 TaxID=3243332 RepID=UPI003F748090
MSRWQWLLRQLTRRLWVRASLIGLLGILAAVLSAFVERFIPWDLPGRIGADAVDSILDILASSMLAVTTFSLSVMTSAYGSATSNVTPRATRLLVEDRTTQNVLSTFIGSFLFAIVGIVVLKTGAYGDRGRLILFVVTIGVIVAIVVSLLRWIDHLTGLGRVGETTKRVEDVTAAAIEARLKEPWLGGEPQYDPPEHLASLASPVAGQDIGYVQHIDMGALAACAAELDADIHVARLPGAFVHPGAVLAWIGPGADSADAGRLKVVRAAFTIGPERSFDQDPRFGLAVLSEIASRALSPAMNDPGTAIDVIGRAVRLMSRWATGCTRADRPEVAHPRVHVPPLASADLFEDAFMAIGRDGAAMIEVQLRLHKGLAALSRLGDEDFRAAARAQAALARARAEAALTLEADRQRLRALD